MLLPEYLSTKEYFSWLMENVSVDHDNTISDTKEIVVEKFNEEFGTNHQAIEISQWYSLPEWCRALGMNKEEALVVNHRYWYDPDLINLARPNPGAIEFLNKANLKGHLTVNSSRPFDQLTSTVGWYRHYAPFIKPEQIVVGLPDLVVPGDIMRQAVSKAWIVWLLGCRAHIEDVVYHAKFILDYTNAFVFLLSDDSSLDVKYKTRLMRFGGINGKPPDMTLLAELVDS